MKYIVLLLILACSKPPPQDFANIVCEVYKPKRLTFALAYNPKVKVFRIADYRLYIEDIDNFNWQQDYYTMIYDKKRYQLYCRKYAGQTVDN
jgi:hypothetical protein